MPGYRLYYLDGMNRRPHPRIDRSNAQLALADTRIPVHTVKMGLALVRRGAAIAIAAPFLLNCKGEGEGNANEPPVSYASREPGSVAAPTNEISFQLLRLDGPTRLASFRANIIQSGKQCNFVTNAVIMGGIDGTDMWRVKCADSGDWAVWFQPGRATEVIRCSNASCS